MMTSALAQENRTASAPAEPREEDLRILEVVLDQIVLSDGMAAYAGSSGGTLVPLQAVSELLGLAISVKTSEGLASGFILDERRTFHLDTGRRQVTISGRQASFASALVNVQRDDIYVDSGLLGEWLPVAFDIDLFALRMHVRPREPLPLQMRLDRERRIRLWRMALAPADAGYPRFRSGYRLWELPFIDQTVRLSLGDTNTANFATYATGDLLFAESEAFLAGSNDELFETARLTLRRRDPDSRLAGPLNATEVAVGHLVHPSSPLLSTASELLPGFLVTNLPLSRPTEFDRHTFRGNLPPGWDVELYHNDALIDYQTSRPDGQYVFNDVPVLFGMNFFRLVFYGPQGQRREEHHRFLLGESLTLPGRLDYRVTGNVENESRRRLSGLLAYGLSRRLTLSGEAASLPTIVGERQYGKLGLRGNWSALFAYADFAQDNTGGTAWQGGFQTRLLGTNILYNREELSGGFRSELFDAALDPIVSRDRLRVDTAIPASILPRIPITLELLRQRLESGAVRMTAQNRISARYRGLSLTNRTLWTTETNIPSRIEAALQLSRYIRRVGVRGELLYSVSPTTFTAANLVIEKQLRSGYRLFANISRSFIGSSHIYSIGFDKTTGSFAAGLTAVRDAAGQTGADLLLSAGLGRDPREDEWEPNARARAPFGAVSLRVFIDQLENGRFDAEDVPIAGVGFTVNGAERPERTSDAGLAFLPELTPQLPADVAVNTRTLEDPQWVAAVEGVRIIPRPGKAEMIDIPVVTTAEIEGTVYTLRNGVRDAVGGAAIELVDAAGAVVQRTSTAYDGFYLLTHVRRGAYQVRVAVTDGSRTVSKDEKTVTIQRGEPVIAGIDLVLQSPLSDEERPAPSMAAQASPAPTPAETPQVAQPKEKVVPASAGEYVVQAGTFAVLANAQRMARSIHDLAPDAAVEQREGYSVVRSGRRTREDAVRLARALAARHIEAVIVRVEGAPAVERGSAHVVQLGAFRSRSNAVALARKAEATGVAAKIVIQQHGSLYLVETAPLPSRREAAAVRDALRRAGLEAIVR